MHNIRICAVIICGFAQISLPAAHAELKVAQGPLLPLPADQSVQYGPVPEPLGPPAGPQPIPEGVSVPDRDGTIVDSPPILMPEGDIELYSRVKYRRERNIAPDAVPMVVSVREPRGGLFASNCCRGCVNVEVCMPPCPPADVKIKRNGNKVCYCFGAYSVEITTRLTDIVVCYHD